MRQRHRVNPHTGADVALWMLVAIFLVAVLESCVSQSSKEVQRQQRKQSAVELAEINTLREPIREEAVVVLPSEGEIWFCIAGPYAIANMAELDHRVEVISEGWEFIYKAIKKRGVFRATRVVKSESLDNANASLAEYVLWFQVENCGAQQRLNVRWPTHDKVRTVPAGSYGDYPEYLEWIEHFARYCAPSSEETCLDYAAAKQGSWEAALRVARGSGDLDPLIELGEKGDRNAAIKLAVFFDKPQYLWAVINSGDIESAYIAYSSLSRRTKALPHAWKWLCVAANAGSWEAQVEAARWHHTGRWKEIDTAENEVLRSIGLEPDDRVTYMWLTLASRNEVRGVNYSPRFIAKFLEDVRKGMTESDLAQAEQMVRDWKPGDCPSAEHRLGPPSET